MPALIMDRGETDVDEIVNKIGSCHIAEHDKLAKDDDRLAESLEKLSIGQDHNKELSHADEITHSSEDNSKENKSDVVEKEDAEEDKEATAKPDQIAMVKLEAPECIEEEENEDSETSEGPSEVVARGPSMGVPSQSYSPRQCVDSHGSVVSYGQPDQSLYMNMPASFPDHSNFNLANYVAVDNINSKRRMDVQETYYEPLKFTRPQGEANNLNNLNDSIASPKKMNNLYQKQMCGGSVMYTTADHPASPEQIVPGDHGASDSQAVWGCGNQFVERMNSLDLPLTWEGMNIPFDNIDVDELLGIENLPEKEQEEQRKSLVYVAAGGTPHQTQMSTNSVAYISRQQQQYQQYSQHQQPNQQYPQQQQQFPKVLPPQSGPLPSFSSLRQGANFDFSKMQNNQQPQDYQKSIPITISKFDAFSQQQQQQQSPHTRTMSRSSLYANADDLGYGSDLSPAQDMSGSPPLPSPASINMASPCPSMASPPGPNFSPPPSNMSQDSGTGSIALEDEFQGKDEEYHCTYIEDHLEDLNDALHVASCDLMAERLGLSEGSLATHPQVSFPVAPLPASGHITANVPNMEEICPDTDHVSSQKRNPKPTQPANSGAPPRTAGVNVNNRYVPPQNTQPLVFTSAGQQRFTVDGQNVNLNSSEKKPMSNKIQNTAVQRPAMRQVVTDASGVPVVITTTTTTAPIVNKDGKIAISPWPTNKPKQQEPGCIMGPLLIIPPMNTTTSRPAPRYKPIAPRVPSNPAGNNVTHQEAGRKEAPNPQALNGNSCAPGNLQHMENGFTGKKRDPPASQMINLARRIVAEMKRSDVSKIDKDGDTQLHIAVSAEDADQYLLQAFLERLRREDLTEMIDQKNLMEQTPLYLAVSTNNPEKVRCLLDYSADVNPFANREHPTGAIEKSAAIHCASSNGAEYLDTLKVLMTAPDINLNLVNSDGHTGLHCAILAHGKTTPSSVLNSIPIIQALIRAGADPNLQAKTNGKTALMLALESGNLDLISSTFQMVDPTRLPAFLKTQSFDNNSCIKLAAHLKRTLEPADQHRLQAAMRPVVPR